MNLTPEKLRDGVMSLIPAQHKALVWLAEVPRGEWRNKAGRLHAALTSLGRAYPNFIECRCGNFGKRGGYEIQWRIKLGYADTMELEQRHDPVTGLGMGGK